MSAINLERRIAQIEHEQSPAGVEQSARDSVTCPCCGETKQPGALVCWTCFKVDVPSGKVAPFKWSNMDFAAWLKEARAS